MFHPKYSKSCKASLILDLPLSRSRKHGIEHILCELRIARTDSLLVFKSSVGTEVGVEEGGGDRVGNSVWLIACGGMVEMGIGSSVDAILLSVWTGWASGLSTI
jgi:hypothetical protein